MQIHHLAEMIPIDRERDRQRKQLRPHEQRPEQQLPVLGAFPADDPQPQHRPEECPDIFPVQRDPDLRRLVFLQKGLNPCIIILGSVQRPHHRPVTLLQHVDIHDLRDDVRPAVHVIARERPRQPPVLLHALVQPCPHGSLQQPHHGGHDPALLDEVDLLLECGWGIVVEPDDEPALYLQPGALDPFHVRHQVAVQVLFLVALRQAVVVGGFHPDEDRIEPGLGHHVHQRLIVRNVDRDLGVERHPLLALAPFDQRRQQVAAQLLFIADQVVVHEKDRLPPAVLVQPVQLADDLRRGLNPGCVPEQRGDVAELAVERAAA